MKKEDLQCNYAVAFANGKTGLISNIQSGKCIFVDELYIISLSEYNDKLMNRGDSEYDIVSVYGLSERIPELNEYYLEDVELLWRRYSHIPSVSESDFLIKLQGSGYNYIARNGDNTLSVSPTSMEYNPGMNEWITYFSVNRVTRLPELSDFLSFVTRRGRAQYFIEDLLRTPKEDDFCE